MVIRKAQNFLVVLLSFAVFLFSYGSVYASDPYYKYSYGWGGSGSYPVRIMVDSLENVYIAGFFSGTQDMDPTSGIDSITATASTNVFLTKLNVNGGYEWTKTFGNANGGSIVGLRFDSQGNMYLGLTYKGVLDVDPGAGIVNATSLGNADTIIIKLSSEGVYSSYINIGGVSASVYAYNFVFDGLDNMIIGGYFTGNADFDPTGGTDSYTSVADNGYYDPFVTKINFDGTYNFTKTFGTINTELSMGSFTDSSNAIYMLGYFNTAMDFDPSGSVDTHTPIGNQDIFVTKFSSTGVYQWTKTWGKTGITLNSPRFNIGPGNKIDLILQVYNFTGLDLDPGVGVVTHNLLGLQDAVLVRLDTDGNYVLNRVFGGSGSARQWTADFTYDPSGNMYITGYYVGTIDEDPGAGTSNLSDAATGYDHLSLVALDASANFLWAKQSSNTNTVDGLAVIANANSVYVAGNVYGTADMNPSGTSDLISGDELNGSNSISKWDFLAPVVSSPSNSSTTSTATSSYSPPTCSDLPPVTSPNIFNVTRFNNQATISFTPVTGNVTGYQLMYGFKPGDERYSATIQGQTSGVVQFTINFLSPTSQYSFWVRAMSNCSSGPWSNTYTSAPEYTVSAAAITPAPEISPTVTPTPAETQTLVPEISPLATDSLSSAPEQNLTDQTFIKIVDVNGVPVPYSHIAVVKPTPETLGTSTENIITPITDFLSNVFNTIVALPAGNSGNLVSTILPSGVYQIIVDTNFQRFIDPGYKIESGKTNVLTLPVSIETLFSQNPLPEIIDYSVKATGAVAAVSGMTFVAISAFSFLASLLIVLKLLLPIYSGTSRNVLLLPVDLFVGIWKWVLYGINLVFTMFAGHIFIFKKQQGLVFNSSNNLPVSGAYVVLFSPSGNLSTDFTDKLGRYHLNPKPDTYKLRTEAFNFIYPSKKIIKIKSSQYSNIYNPEEEINISEKTSNKVNYSIPLDPRFGGLSLIKTFILSLLSLLRVPVYIGLFFILLFASLSANGGLYSILLVAFFIHVFLRLLSSILHR